MKYSLNKSLQEAYTLLEDDDFEFDIVVPEEEDFPEDGIEEVEVDEYEDGYEEEEPTETDLEDRLETIEDKLEKIENVLDIETGEYEADEFEDSVEYLEDPVEKFEESVRRKFMECSRFEEDVELTEELLDRSDCKEVFIPRVANTYHIGKDRVKNILLKK